MLCNAELVALVLKSNVVSPNSCCKDLKISVVFPPHTPSLGLTVFVILCLKSRCWNILSYEYDRILEGSLKDTGQGAEFR